jgi:hypothetical protein
MKKDSQGKFRAGRDIYDSNICCECRENYLFQDSIKIWLDSVWKSRKWLCESCTVYWLFNNSCGMDEVRKKTKTLKRPDAASLPHPRERCHKCSPFFALGLWSHFFTFRSCRFCAYIRRIAQVINISVFFKYTDFQHLWTPFLNHD